MPGSVVWKWKVDAYRHATGSSMSKSSPREAFAEWCAPLPRNSVECGKISTLARTARGEPYLSAFPNVVRRLHALHTHGHLCTEGSETMPSMHETAYPRLKASVTAHDLAEVYTPTPEEITLAASLTRSETAQACFVLLLKTFQRLGYFIYLHDVPDTIVTHIT